MASSNGDNSPSSGLTSRLSSFLNPGRSDSLPPLKPLPAPAPIPARPRTTSTKEAAAVTSDSSTSKAPAKDTSTTKAAKAAPVPPPSEAIPPGPKRRKAMSTIDDIERKWAMAGLVIAVVLTIVYPIYAHYLLHSAKAKATGATTEAFLISGADVLFCLVSLVGLLRRKRTLLSFGFFLLGLAFTLSYGPLGFGFIFLGGWLMVRAYRIQKYGVASAKQVAREAATRPRGSSRKANAAAAKGTKGAATSPGPKAPTANKRYTPKAAPRKKVAKPVE